MRVSLGRKGDYSVRAMLDITKNRVDGRRKAREISAAMEIPHRYVTQILANLVREGLLTAVAGPEGGYSLAGRPEDVTLLDVVEAAEGPIDIDQCVLRGGPCEWTSACPVHAAWSEAQRAFTDKLAKTTFASLSRIDAAIEAGTYQLPSSAPPHASETERGGKR